MTKTLILVRHGEAESVVVDRRQPLSERGLRDVKCLTRWAASVALAVDEIRHSGKLRAEQTAAIIGDGLTSSCPVTAVTGLAPNDDVTTVASQLETGPTALMLVGHLPFLGQLTSLLVSGNLYLPVVDFGTATLVVLERNEERWHIQTVIQGRRLPSD